jgi:hypothetical protein
VKWKTRLDAVKEFGDKLRGEGEENRAERAREAFDAGMPTVVAGFSPPDLLLRGRTSTVQFPSLPTRTGTYLPSIISNNKNSRLSLAVASSFSSSSSSPFDGGLDARGESYGSFNKVFLLCPVLELNLHVVEIVIWISIQVNFIQICELCYGFMQFH